MDYEQKYSHYGHPYLVSAGVENGIKYSFIMSPNCYPVHNFFKLILHNYNENTQYLYLFNAVVFNDVTMDWMVVSRVWLDNQSQNGYKLAFKKTFEHCKDTFSCFKIGETLQSIIFDWSDAQIKGLKEVIGEAEATSLLRGCKVHCLRSCQRVADKVTSPSDNGVEKAKNSI